MKILLSNDDGIHAKGLLSIKQELERTGHDVFVLAPDKPRSACSHSITLHKPMRADETELADGTIGYACSGTPSDCVSLALLGVMEEKPDLVVSGINHGPNLGWDLTYSGTVAAAREGAMNGLPAVALSLATYAPLPDYSLSAIAGAKIISSLEEHKLPKHTLLNINVPSVKNVSDISAVEITRQGERKYSGVLDKRTDPNGRAYYWRGGEVPVDQLDEGSDVKAIKEGKISITPIHLDLTDYKTAKLMGDWKIEEICLERSSG